MFDFNCDVAQEYGVYKNPDAFEIAKYMSSINISAGFHAGDPLSIRKAIEFACENNVAIGAHIGFPDIAGFGNRKMQLSEEEIEALVVYQIGAISSFSKAYDLEIEHVRCHGAMYEMLNQDATFAISLARAVKKVNPWLWLFVGNAEIKKQIEDEVDINCALEATFSENSTIREFRELENKPDTLHFTSLEAAKKAYDVKKPTPVAYNKVGGQV